MSEYFRKNQYYTGVNFGDFRYSPKENRNRNPSPSEECSINTLCYECGEQISLRVTHKIRRNYLEGDLKTIDIVESNLCNECRLEIFLKELMTFKCICGNEITEKVEWFFKNLPLTCKCGKEINTKYYLFNDQVIEALNEFLRENNWSHLFNVKKS